MAGWMGLEPAPSGVTVCDRDRPALIDNPHASQTRVNAELARSGIVQPFRPFASFRKKCGTNQAQICQPFLTVREVAAKLRIAPVTVYKICKQGKLAHFRVSNAIRITPSAVKAFIDRTL